MATTTSNPDRDKALGLVLNQIERNFGKGSIMRLGDATRMRVETVPSGALTLDMALGGGLPKGRIVEIYGPESSGKTTLAIHAIAEAQKKGGICAWLLPNPCRRSMQRCSPWRPGNRRNWTRRSARLPSKWR